MCREDDDELGNFEMLVDSLQLIEAVTVPGSCICMYVHMFACICLFVHISRDRGRYCARFVHMYVCTYVCMYMSVCTYTVDRNCYCARFVCMYVRIYVRMFVCVHVCLHVKS